MTERMLAILQAVSNQLATQFYRREEFALFNCAAGSAYNTGCLK
jgi:hypothetical protein